MADASRKPCFTAGCWCMQVNSSGFLRLYFLHKYHNLMCLLAFKLQQSARTHSYRGPSQCLYCCHERPVLQGTAYHTLYITAQYACCDTLRCGVLCYLTQHVVCCRTHCFTRLMSGSIVLHLLQHQSVVQCWLHATADFALSGMKHVQCRQGVVYGL